MRAGVFQYTNIFEASDGIIGSGRHWMSSYIICKIKDGPIDRRTGVVEKEDERIQ